MSEWKAALFLEGGHLYIGRGFGSPLSRGGEAVFNTGMTGYQEIYTDPSYYGQVVVLTGAHVGNTGVNPEDFESKNTFVSAVVARDYCHTPSNWRLTSNLSDFLEKQGVPGVFDVDTREITRNLRQEGAKRCVVFDASELTRGEMDARGTLLLKNIPSMVNRELVSEVSCPKPYFFNTIDSAPLVVVYDFGVKTNILNSWSRRGFTVYVVPYNTPYQEVLKLKPKAVVLSNGPGDPAAVKSVEMIQGIVGEVPIFAICMGHQLLARALGGSTFKLKFGHHGTNHPVLDLIQNKILITSQNHGFGVDRIEGKDVVVTHRSLNDGCLEGFRSDSKRFLSVQFHPEARPGPSDADYLFDYFIKGFLR